MKIEKISDTQVRFTLTREDLAQRQLKLSELAYGTEKARQLFRDMMVQAAAQVGFDATGDPLMIEAIPMAGDSIVLVVTKVQNPEELDTRFASFSPSVEEDGNSDGSAGNILDQLMESIRGHAAGAQKSAGAGPSGESGSASSGTNSDRREEIQQLREYLMMHRLYCFASLDAVIEAARQTRGEFTGTSDLLQDTRTGEYCLFLTMKDINEVSSMQNVLATLSEYGRVEAASYAREQHALEHARVIARDHALQTLAQI